MGVRDYMANLSPPTAMLHKLSIGIIGRIKTVHLKSDDTAIEHLNRALMYSSYA